MLTLTLKLFSHYSMDMAVGQMECLRFVYRIMFIYAK